jgi:Tfp pilus assembly protein PilF
MADFLCAQRKPNEAVPYMLKAMEDEHNVDIFITCAFVQQNLAESLEMLHDGKLRGSYLSR